MSTDYYVSNGVVYPLTEDIDQKTIDVFICFKEEIRITDRMIELGLKTIRSGYHKIGAFESSTCYYFSKESIDESKMESYLKQVSVIVKKSNAETKVWRTGCRIVF